jgi:hypothetical protein
MLARLPTYRRCRVAEMNAWWWLPIGLTAWFAMSMAVGLWLGPVLKSCSQAREALDQQMAEILAVPRPRECR